MADFTITIDVKQLQAFATTMQVKAQSGLVAAYSPQFKRRLIEGANATTYNLTGAVLHRRTGNLARAVGWELQQGAEKVTGRVGIIKQGPALKYSMIHMSGGVLRPTHGQWLTIPLPAMLTSAGVARGTARSVPNSFFIRSKRGNLLLVRKRPGGIEPLFVLKREVRIPKRDFFTGPKDQTIRAVEADIAQLIRNELVLN